MLPRNTTQLDVAINALSKDIIDKEIVTILQTDRQKRRLDIRCSASGIDIQYLLSAIESCSLTFLSIRFCKLTDEDAPHIAKYIASNPISLEELDLSNNRFTDKGADLILCALEKNTVLNKVEFRNNKVKNVSILDQFKKICKQNQEKKLAAIHNIVYPTRNDNVISIIESYLNWGLFPKSEKTTQAEEKTFESIPCKSKN